MGWRLFSPVDLPIVNVSDYINVILLPVFVIGFVAYAVVGVDREYRFHKKTGQDQQYGPFGVMQQVLLAGLECQDNKMIFPDDVESMERVDGFDKYVRMQVRAHYVVSGGISQPFSISAFFMSKKVKLQLVDPTCAACGGQRQQATEFWDKLSSLNKFKPGLLAQ